MRTIQCHSDNIVRPYNSNAYTNRAARAAKVHAHLAVPGVAGDADEFCLAKLFPTVGVAEATQSHVTCHGIAKHSMSTGPWVQIF